MSEEKFTELVNLYLDKEITCAELASLKRELRASPDREKAFRERVRLEQAMCAALKAAGPECRTQRREFRSKDRGSAVAFPRWALGSGLAASFLLAAFFLPHALRLPSASHPSAPEVTLAIEKDPLDSVKKSEFRRYMASKQADYVPHASLASHMRLLGLRPEFTPVEKQLETIELVDLEPSDNVLEQAELLKQIQEFETFPEIEIWAEQPDVHHAGTSFGSGFGASLVSF